MNTNVIADTSNWMPLAFMGLLGLALLIYVILDGYDLGVGILLIAFPKAQGLILHALYGPVTLMLLGLILRGAAFDFRVKAHAQWKPLWDRAFSAGSLLASLAQGWMLGRYVTGFAEGWAYTLFAACIALALASAYALLGAGWLLMKTEGALQLRAVAQAKRVWPAVVIGLALISVTTPLVSPTVRARWFQLPELIALLPIPLVTALALLALRGLLNSHRVLGKACWAPFLLMVLVMLMGFFGLAYSLYPFVMVDRITVWQAAAAPESLAFIGVGCAITVPVILAYTVFSYRVFWGKATELLYA